MNDPAPIVGIVRGYYGYVMASRNRAEECLRHWQEGYDAHLRMFAHDKRRTKDLLIPPIEAACKGGEHAPATS